MNVAFYIGLTFSMMGLLAVLALVLYKLYTMRVFVKAMLFKLFNLPFVRIDVWDSDTRTMRSKYIKLPKDLKEREVIVDGIRRRLDHHGAFIDSIFHVPAYAYIGDNYEPIKIDSKVFSSQPIDAKTLDRLLFYYYSLGKTQAEKRDEKVLQFVQIGLIVSVLVGAVAGFIAYRQNQMEGALVDRINTLEGKVDKILATPLFSTQTSSSGVIGQQSQQTAKVDKNVMVVG